LEDLLLDSIPPNMVRYLTNRIILPVLLNISKSSYVVVKIKIISGLCHQFPFWILESLIIGGGYYLYLTHSKDLQVDLLGFIMSVSNLYGLILLQSRKNVFIFLKFLLVISSKFGVLLRIHPQEAEIPSIEWKENHKKIYEI
jgi:hypothetical protein